MIFSDKSARNEKRMKKRNILTPLEAQGRSVIYDTINWFDAKLAPKDYGVNGEPCTLLVNIYQFLFLISGILFCNFKLQLIIYCMLFKTF